LADLLNGARAIIDHRVEIAIRGRVAEADQHGLSTLIMLFKSSSVKPDLSARRQAKFLADHRYLRNPCSDALHDLLAGCPDRLPG
jgi:hypothetical protein